MTLRNGLHLAGMVAGFLAVMPAAVSQAQMSLPGSFDVSDTGAATYTIPIAVPPGTAGMQPALSLAYNSQGGNGLLGMGWSLSGLPAVTRCPKTIAQDGAMGGIAYDTNDRFCLEGQRLIAISGTYGADQTEYRTELEGFSKVVSYGTAGTGPAWFKVWTKSGQVMELGNTADSRIEAQGKATARLWSINKIGDTKGNYLAVTYAEDNVNGEYRPTRIDYTGNSSAGVSPFASVRFVYALRPDAMQLHEAGAIIKTTHRLTNVQAYSGESLVGDYRLAYQQDSSVPTSRPSSITLCVGENICLPPTTFDTTAGGNGSFSSANYNIPYSLNFGASPDVNYMLIAGDFNGDGKSDFALLRDTLLFTFMSEGLAGYTLSGIEFPYGWNFGTPPTTDNMLITGDFNGDGKTDFALLRNTILFTFLSNGDGTFVAGSILMPYSWAFGTPPTTDHSLIVGDFNGDGRSDFALLRNTILFTFLSNGDGTFLAGSILIPYGWAFGTPPTANFALLSGDFNGDGRTDFSLFKDTLMYTFLSNGDGTFTANGMLFPYGWNFGTPPGMSYAMASGDFNGDGKTDFALINGTLLYSFISSGDGYFVGSGMQLPNGWNFGTPPTASWVVTTGDVNGDGKSDIAFLQGANVYSLLSLGNGTFSPASWVMPFGWTLGSLGSMGMLIPGDFNGDSKSDFAVLSGSTVHTFMSNGGGFHQLSSVTTGLGATTSVTYETLALGGAYTKDNDAAYPQQDIRPPVFTVIGVDSSNGLGGTYSTSYRYAGAKVSLNGRGFLGFRQTEVTDLQTGIEQITTYLQAHPYTGLVAARVKKLGATTLNETANTYAQTALGGTRSFVYLTQSVEKSWELNGSLVSQVTTTHQYDAYGNATQVAVSTPDGYSKTTTNTYQNDALNWLLGRLTRASVTSVTPN